MPSDPSEWLRRRQLQCEDIADLLPGIVDGDDATDKRITQHVESCLRCQAELVQYRQAAAGPAPAARPTCSNRRPVC